MPDKYTAVWVSHSSMGDFIKCPRAYFLHNVFRNDAGHRINIVNPHLSLGIAVHDTLEGLLKYRAEDRFKKPLMATFEENWKKVSGKVGGFKTKEEEEEVKNRARAMIMRAENNRGFLERLAVRLPDHANNMPPNFYLSEEHNIILSGKIDWLEWVEADDSVRVIDFKTGKNDEEKTSLQLPIYGLLLKNLQKRQVSGAAYWYLERNDGLTEVELPELSTSKERVLEIAMKVKAAREKQEFACPRGPAGCFACKPYEKILKGEAGLVYVDETRRTEMYMV